MHKRHKLTLTLLFYTLPLGAKTLDQLSSPKEACQRLEGRTVSHYQNVYRVKGCKLTPIDHDEVYRLTKTSKRITEIDANILRLLPIAEANPQKAPSCKRIEGKYAIYSASDAYFIEGCKKRKFQDWESFEDHRRRNPHIATAHLKIAAIEQIEEGTLMPSVVDEDLDLDGFGASAEVIPVDEACQAVKRFKFVSYFDHIYFVNNCKKHVVNTMLFSRLNLNGRVTLKELNSRVWLSLPDGPKLSDSQLKKLVTRKSF